MIAIPLKSIMQCTFAPVRDTIHNTKTPCGCYSAMLHLCGVCAFMESMCMCDCEICISAWTTPQMSSWTTQRCCIFVECARSWNPCACATVKYALVLGLRRGPVGQMSSARHGPVGIRLIRFGCCSPVDTGALNKIGARLHHMENLCFFA